MELADHEAQLCVNPDGIEVHEEIRRTPVKPDFNINFRGSDSRFQNTSWYSQWKRLHKAVDLEDEPLSSPSLRTMQQTYNLACSEVSHILRENVTDHELLREISKNLFKNVNVSDIENARESLAKLENDTNPERIQGSLAEIWTFQENSDIDVALRCYYGHRYGFVPCQDPGMFQIFLPIEDKSCCRCTAGEGCYKPSCFPCAKRIYPYKYRKSIVLLFAYLFQVAFLFILALLDIENYKIPFLNQTVFEGITRRPKHPKTLNISSADCFNVLTDFHRGIYYCLSLVIIIPILSVSFTALLERLYTMTVTYKAFANFKFFTQRWKSGPAFKTTTDFTVEEDGQIVRKETDYVFCVLPNSTAFMPGKAWSQRMTDRFGKESLSKFESCKVGMIMHADPYWRWSFSELENRIIRDLDPVEGLTLCLLKRQIKAISIKPTLKSYPIKTAYFWCRHFSESWTQEDICVQAVRTYCFLLRMISFGFLPNYFHMDENILTRQGRSIRKLPELTEFMQAMMADAAVLSEQRLPAQIETMCGVLKNWKPISKPAAETKTFCSMHGDNMQKLYGLNSGLYSFIFLILSVVLVSMFWFYQHVDGASWLKTDKGNPDLLGILHVLFACATGISVYAFICTGCMFLCFRCCY